MNGIAGRSGGGRLHGQFDTSEYDGGPIKPKNMPQRQSEVWDEVLSRLPQEALRKCDSYLLFELSGYIVASQHIMSEWLLNPSNATLAKIKNQTTQKIQSLSALFGLSPADRKRIQIATPKEEEDELTEFT
jgi:phage terminase small subunit